MRLQIIPGPLFFFAYSVLLLPFLNSKRQFSSQVMSDKQMKAVHYEGPFKVSVKDVPLPQLEHPDDAIIKVTTAGESFVTRTVWVFLLPPIHPLTLDSILHGFTHISA